MSAARPAATSFGPLIRQWRERRRLTQLELSLDAEISTRHLSFMETGRAKPSKDMIIRLCDQLAIPLRERNLLMKAAGFAPLYGEHGLESAVMGAARHAVDLILKGHEPFPAVAIDRHWRMVAANSAIAPLLAGVAAHLLEPPVNVLRLTLHPEGMASRVANYHDWRAHLLERLRHDIDASGDPTLDELHAELAAYPSPVGAAVPTKHASPDYAGIAVPFQFRTDDGVLSFFSTTTVFGTPTDVILAELALECFFPADEFTAVRLTGTAV